MGGAAGKQPKHWPVELVVSELGNVPGCKAYHTSVVIGGAEYSFSDDGIAVGASEPPESHFGRPTSRLAAGTATSSSASSAAAPGEFLQSRLVSHFAPGTYDLLRKNCNSFSDCALTMLVGKRLDPKYRQLERAGARFPQLVATLSRGAYSPNPSADGFDLDRLCKELRFGPQWAAAGRAIGAEEDAAAPGAAASSSGPRGKPPKGRRNLVRVLILPFQDTYELNFDHMHQKYILPYVRSIAVSDPESGSGLHVGDEFSANGGRVRFRVVSCEPAEGGLPTSNTVVCYEGDPIERTVLKAVTVLPLESSMTLLNGAGAAELAREFVGPFLEQRSADLVAGQVLEIRGARFKVMGTDPASGGGACSDTRLNTAGRPVRVCSSQGCEALPAKVCREKSCKAGVCLAHASSIQEGSCLCPLHAPVKRGLFGRRKE